MSLATFHQPSLPVAKSSAELPKPGSEKRANHDRFESELSAERTTQQQSPKEIEANQNESNELQSSPTDNTRMLFANANDLETPTDSLPPIEPVLEPMADPLAALVSAQSETEPTSTVMNAPVVASEQPAPVPLQPTITSSSDEPLNAIALLQPDNNAADDATANLTHSDTGDESTTHDGKASLSASSVGESTIPFQEAGTKEATAISKTNAQRILSEVSTQLSDLASYSSDGSQRRLLIQLHPAELGQVALQVEWNDDRLTAKIVANDSATSEMLAQNKPRLVEALAENGIELDAFEVAHQNDPDHQAFQQNESGQNISLSKRANESGPSTQVHPDHDDANQRLNLLI